jgi:hypothetical protein
MYQPSENDLDNLNKAFRYHAPHGDQPARYESLRGQGRILAAMILSHCPLSRERALALTKLEEAIMWANAAIARNERTDPVPGPQNPPRNERRTEVG